MIIYIFKTILCSGLLFLVYRLFLEKEKMHRFKRFYLLFSIAFSITVPLLLFRTNTPVIPVPVSEIINASSESFNDIIFQQVSSPINETDYLPIFLSVFYAVITAFLFYRFFKNIVVVFSKIKKAKTVPYFDARLVLTKDKLVPHSFLKYIFIDKEDFEKGTIEKEILRHELTHVKQKHSIDILFVEMLLVFVWFNPFFYLYKKAIKLNHEFLAVKTLSKIFRIRAHTSYFYLIKLNKQIAYFSQVHLII